MIKLLYRPIDTAILVYFRIFAGILMSQELINGIFIGKFQDFVQPQFHFNYMFFEWISPWPYWGMVAHYSLTIIAGFMVALNYRYRLFSIILFLGHTLLFLMEASHYINHHYLYCLVSFWMMFLPLDKTEKTAPAWTLYLILFHMGLAYFFAGVAKLNSDWLSGTPMDIYLASRKDYPLGFIYSRAWAPMVFSYGGLLFDLLIVPLMIFRRTRVFGLISSIAFHLSNVMMFGLATFPWFSLLLTSMFFDPSWPRKVPILKDYMPWGPERFREHSPNKIAISVLASYVLIHTVLPLRHFFYPGITSWTEEGHMFAWRMMLRNKQGQVHFFVQDKESKKMIRANLDEHISRNQYKDLIGKPDLILQLAKYLRTLYEREWNSKVAVYASSRVSLNGRPVTEMIQPGVDLAQEKRSLLPYSWIRPLEQKAKVDSDPWIVGLGL